MVTKAQHRGIYIYKWAFDNEHILDQSDDGGNEDYHLYSVALKTGVRFETLLHSPESGGPGCRIAYDDAERGSGGCQLWTHQFHRVAWRIHRKLCDRFYQRPNALANSQFRVHSARLFCRGSQDR